MMTEMEFFKEFEFLPMKNATHETVECWKRDSGKYGEISRWGPGEFHVYMECNGYQHAGQVTTFTRALRLLIKKVEEEEKK